LLAVAALIGTVLTLAFSSVATAGGIITSYYTDPQNTNVPYVA